MVHSAAHGAQRLSGVTAIPTHYIFQFTYLDPMTSVPGIYVMAQNLMDAVEDYNVFVESQEEPYDRLTDNLRHEVRCVGEMQEDNSILYYGADRQPLDPQDEELLLANFSLTEDGKIYTE